MRRNFRINIIDTRTSHVMLERFVEKGSMKIDYQGSDSRFDSIMSSSFTISIDNETAEDARYLDLFAGEERRYKVEVLDLDKPLSKQLMWQGYILPDVYSEPYTNVRFFVRFSATDGLASLKEKPFVHYKTENVITYIARCLFETGLKQDIYFAPGIWNSAMLWWHQIQIFEEWYREERKDGSVKRKNCYEVLESLLKAVGATLFTWAGKWYIIGYNRRHLVTDTFQVYDHFGKVKTNLYTAKNVIDGVFAEGLRVNMSQPFKSVMLNVAYQKKDGEVIDPLMYSNPDLTSEEIESSYTNTSVHEKAPMRYWVSTGSARKMLGNNDGRTTLVVNEENINVHNVYAPGYFPEFRSMPPGNITVYSPANVTTNWQDDYIELRDMSLYLSPQSDDRPQNFTLNFKLAAYRYVDEEKYNEDFYKQIFRIEVLIGNQVIFTTRGDVAGYDSANLEMKFFKGEVGADYIYYVLPNIIQPAGTVKRYYLPNRIEATIKDIKVESGLFGPLRVRLYVARNADNQKILDGKHVLHVRLTHADIKVDDWVDESYRKTRALSSSTKFETDLAFSDGKSSLYMNLFKLNERSDYVSEALGLRTVLANGYTSEDAVNYYITFPGNVAGGFIDRIEKNYSSLRIGSPENMLYVNRIFGDLSVESGFYINRMGDVVIRKSRIDEFPEYREILHGMTRLDVMSTTFYQGILEYDRDKYIEWQRYGSSQKLRYLDAYSRMIHDCQSTYSPRLEGDLLKIISPLDLVKFNFMGEKNYFPSRLTIDLTSGKSRVYLIEGNLNTVEDYVD